MKKVLLAFLTLLLVVGSGATQERNKAPDIISYVNPSHYSNYTFKFDKSKGFKLKYKFTKKDFNGKMPEVFHFSFHGPQPVNVEAYTTTCCLKKTRLAAFPLDHGKYWIMDNLYNKDVHIEILIHDPPERHEKRWKQYEVKVEGTYIDAESKKDRLFSYEAFRVRGVVGFGTESEKHTFRVDLAKGHPKIKEIKKKVEDLAKKYGCKVIKWEEREGFDFLWKEKKK